MVFLPRTILIVDDDAEAYAVREHLFIQDHIFPCVFIVVSTAAEARTYCRTESPDAVVIATVLSDGDGLTLLADLLNAHGALTFAIILLVDPDSQALGIQALQLGAHDYVLKRPDFHQDLSHAIATAITQVELRRQNAALLRELTVRDRQLPQATTQVPTAFDHTVLDSLSAHIAVLDHDGVIVAVNAAWRRFAHTNGLDANQVRSLTDVGINYLAVCRASAEAGDEYANVAYIGLRDVLDGNRDSFTLEYPCHSPQEQRWFMMQATPVAAPLGGVAVTHTQITRRHLAEVALHQSEDRFAKAFRANPAPLVIFRRSDGCFLEANETYQQLLGYHHEELIDHTALELQIFPDAEAHAELLDQLDAQGVIRDYEIVVRTKTDERRTMLLACEVIELDGDTCVLAIGIDITERKRAQVALRAERVRLEWLQGVMAALLPTRTCEDVLSVIVHVSTTTLGAQSSVAAVIEPNGNLRTFIDERVDMTFTQVAFDILLTDTIRQRKILWFQSRAAYVAHYPQLAQGWGDADDAVICVPFLLGERAVGALALRIPPPHPTSGIDKELLEAIAYQCAQALDRALLYDALRVTEQKLTTLVDVLPIGISILNHQRTMIYANPAMEYIMGMSHAELLASAYQRRRYIRPDGTPMANWAFASTRASAEQQLVQNTETGIVDDDGNVTWVNVSAVPVALADWSVVSAAVDITERKRAENALRESQQQLQDLSVQLINAQEDERRTLAYELHDEIGQQLTGVSMALEGGMQAVADPLRTRLHEAQQLVAVLIRQVRELSLKLRPAMLDDMGLLTTLRWHIERYMEQTGVVIDFKYRGLDGPLPPHIAITVYRIVQEGLTNIARHAQTRAALVYVWSSAGQLKITIEDQGCGFDTTVTQLAGRSIGLVSMQERTQFLGGQFTIDSTPGEGTHIRVSLPLDTTRSI